MTFRPGSKNWTAFGGRTSGGFSWPRGKSSKWFTRPPRRESVSRSRRGREDGVMDDERNAQGNTLPGTGGLLAMTIPRETSEMARRAAELGLNDPAWAKLREAEYVEAQRDVDAPPRPREQCVLAGLRLRAAIPAFLAMLGVRG